MPKRCRYVSNAPRCLGATIAPGYLCRIWCLASFDSPAECLPALWGTSMSSKTWLTFRMWSVLLTSARQFIHTFGPKRKYLAGKGICVFHFSFVIILIKYLPHSCGSSPAGNVFTFYSLHLTLCRITSGFDYQQIESCSMLNNELIGFKGVEPSLATSLLYASDVTTRLLLAAELALFIVA